MRACGGSSAPTSSGAAALATPRCRPNETGEPCIDAAGGCCVPVRRAALPSASLASHLSAVGPTRVARRACCLQGMHCIVGVLLAHMDDEAAFWTLNAMVFQLLPRDFYAQPPASMNGLLIEMAAAAELVCQFFPQLIAREQVLPPCQTPTARFPPPTASRVVPGAPRSAPSGAPRSAPCAPLSRRGGSAVWPGWQSEACDCAEQRVLQRRAGDLIAVAGAAAHRHRGAAAMRTPPLGPFPLRRQGLRGAAATVAGHCSDQLSGAPPANPTAVLAWQGGEERGCGSLPQLDRHRESHRCAALAATLLYLLQASRDLPLVSLLALIQLNPEGFASVCPPTLGPWPLHQPVPATFLPNKGVYAPIFRCMWLPRRRCLSRRCWAPRSVWSFRSGGRRCLW